MGRYKLYCTFGTKVCITFCQTLFTIIIVIIIIMVTELGGVQFGLNSYLGFQKQTRPGHLFDLKSQVWLQTKIAWHKVEWPILSMKESIRSHGSCINQNKYPFPRTWLQLQWFPAGTSIRKDWPLPLYYIYFEIAQFSFMIITTVVSEGISLDSWGIVVMEQVALEEINEMISASQMQNNSSKCIIEYLCLANAK